MPIRELAMFLVMCLVWGSHLVVVKATAGPVVDPIFYAAVRMSLVALILSPLLKIHKGQMRRIAAAGLCLGGLNYALMFTGLNFANASVGAITLELYAPVAMVLSVIFLKERVGVPRILGLAFAIAGVALIAASSRQDGMGSAPLFGIALLVGAAVSEASGAILVKTITGVKPFELLGWFAIFGAAFLWGATALVERDQLAVFDTGSTTMLFAGALAYTVLGASLFGHTTYYWLIQRLPVNQLSSSTLLISLFAIAGGVFFLGEPLTWQFFVGGAMTLGGVGTILLRTRARRSPTPEAASAVTPTET